MVAKERYFGSISHYSLPTYLDWTGLDWRLLRLPFHVLLVIYVRLQIYTASVGWRFKGAENGV